MPTPKLTIAELLRKHLPQTGSSYNFNKTNAPRFDLTAKKFGRYYRGESLPNSETTMAILDELGMLKTEPDKK